MFRELGKYSRLDLGVWMWDVCMFWGLLQLGSEDFKEILFYLANVLPGSAVPLALGINHITLGVDAFLMMVLQMYDH